MALKALHLLACLLEDCSEDTGLEWNRSNVIKRKKKKKDSSNSSKQCFLKSKRVASSAWRVLRVILTPQRFQERLGSSDRSLLIFLRL